MVGRWTGSKRQAGQAPEIPFRSHWTVLCHMKEPSVFFVRTSDLSSCVVLSKLRQGFTGAFGLLPTGHRAQLGCQHRLPGDTPAAC